MAAACMACRIAFPAGCRGSAVRALSYSVLSSHPDFPAPRGERSDPSAFKPDPDFDIEPGQRWQQPCDRVNRTAVRSSADHPRPETIPGGTPSPFLCVPHPYASDTRQPGADRRPGGYQRSIQTLEPREGSSPCKREGHRRGAAGRFRRYPGRRSGNGPARRPPRHQRVTLPLFSLYCRPNLPRRGDLPAAAEGRHRRPAPWLHRKAAPRKSGRRPAGVPAGMKAR